ncbi:hypothetical protein [Bordetella avium]|uniref:Phage protein n=1 Tax=Bordetella avium (strain 197N) TaxID=360910 RepID=Q2L2W0_BORA1|nr:hypothetical protein [Bordetella avium]RIQ51170.1 hypothetical protein D0844_13785 [Bordetella avium]CAJ48929.1 phage protein [Bordetella avium 197N]
MKTKSTGGTERLKRALAEVSAKRVQVGFFDTAQYPDGTPVAYVAAIQEFGYPQGNIPARPFMRPTVKARELPWAKQVAGVMMGVIKGEVTAQHGFEQVGALAAGDIARAISKVSSPPLKESTLQARQSRKKTPGVSKKPLVDTGLMIQSVTYQVEEKS